MSIGLLHLVALGLVITAPRIGSPRAGRVSNAVGLGRIALSSAVFRWAAARCGERSVRRRQLQRFCVDARRTAAGSWRVQIRNASTGSRGDFFERVENV